MLVPVLYWAWRRSVCVALCDLILPCNCIISLKQEQFVHKTSIRNIRIIIEPWLNLYGNVNYAFQHQESRICPWWDHEQEQFGRKKQTGVSNVSGQGVNWCCSDQMSYWWKWNQWFLCICMASTRFDHLFNEGCNAIRRRWRKGRSLEDDWTRI